MNIFQRFFSRFKRTIKVIFNRSEYMPCGTLRDNETVSSIAHTVGTNIAKLSPQVIRKDAYGITIKNDRLSRLLAIRPCPEMSIGAGVRYMGINFPKDICDDCRTSGVFDTCPACGSKKITRIRRVSGYLEILDGFTNGKKNEEKSRKSN